jgi:uncharacterized protein (UPF0261 family)
VYVQEENFKMSVLTVYNQDAMGKEIKRATRVDFRFSDEDMAYLSLLMKKTGLNRTGVVVQALRDMARSKRISADDVADALAKASQPASEEG